MMKNHPTNDMMDNAMKNPSVEWDTLDEPIWDTVHRDLSNIITKLRFVLLAPMIKQQNDWDQICKNWDLWGPFIFCAFIAFSVNNCGADCEGVHQSNFSTIFALMWIGNFIMSLNYQLLLQKKTPKTTTILDDQFIMANADAALSSSSLRPMSIFQLLCLFGYCLAIPTMGIFSFKLFHLIFHSHDGDGTLWFILKTVMIFVFCFLYPLLSCDRMLSVRIPVEKYFLIMYPILMFFSVLSLYVYTFI